MSEQITDIFQAYDSGTYTQEQAVKAIVDLSKHECEWRKSGKKIYFMTSCNQTYPTPEHPGYDIPQNPKFKYCPYCRGEIKEIS